LCIQIVQDDSIADGAQEKVVFESDSLSLDLRYVADSSMEDVEVPTVEFETLVLDEKGHLGPAVVANLELQESQSVTFILRTPPKKAAIKPVVATTKDAEALGIPLQVLIEGASKLRPRDDPILTMVRYCPAPLGISHS